MKAIVAVIWLGFVAVVLFAIVRKILRGKSRRMRILEQRRTISLSEVANLKTANCLMVSTNLGYGGEDWFLATKEIEMDFADMTIRGGKLVIPRPSYTQLQKFCEAHGIDHQTFLTK